MLVKDVMNKNVVVAKADVTVKEASKVMTEYNIGGLVIMEGEDIVGMVTDTDIIRSIAQGKDVNKTTMNDLMTKKVITADPEDTIESVVDTMVKHHIKRIPVVEDGKIKGIITASDIIVVEPKLIESISGLISMKLPGLQGG
jgi:CBS domain-containing protein